ncbi:MAG: carboxymuconolactone decarboxylase family protein [Alphaproteobacteria bacterium]
MTRRIEKAITDRGEQALMALHDYVEACGLEAALVELVYVRVSQMNGCAYCLAMHGALARDHGVDAVRLDTLAAWRGSAAFTERERAALAWAESVTDVAQGVPDAEYARARAAFDDRELAHLTWAVVAINAWNRAMVAFRVPIGED